MFNYNRAKVQTMDQETIVQRYLYSSTDQANLRKSISNDDSEFALSNDVTIRVIYRLVIANIFSLN